MARPRSKDFKRWREHLSTKVNSSHRYFPGVGSSAGIGLPNNDLGNSVHASVDAPPGTLTETQLLEFLAERLVRYKIPRSAGFVEEPLRVDTGKLHRKDPRAQKLVSGA